MEWIIALGQLACLGASLVFTTIHPVLEHIKDYGHLHLPLISTSWPHMTSFSLAALAFFVGQDTTRVFLHVYAPAMFIKATLMPLTILPDSNPQCKTWHPYYCLTRNDMLPSGHMIIACSAALCLPFWGKILAGATGVLLVASRMHFSVDVILSVWLVALLEK
jgi:hypothetical protein